MQFLADIYEAFNQAPTNFNPQIVIKHSPAVLFEYEGVKYYAPYTNSFLFNKLCAMYKKALEEAGMEYFNGNQSVVFSYIENTETDEDKDLYSKRFAYFLLSYSYDKIDELSNEFPDCALAVTEGVEDLKIVAQDFADNVALTSFAFLAAILSISHAPTSVADLMNLPSNEGLLPLLSENYLPYAKGLFESPTASAEEEE
jgi:hypothetical protein